MAQSEKLTSEVEAMRRLEAAYRYAETLPAKAKARVVKWAAEEFHDTSVTPDIDAHDTEVKA